MAYITTFSLSTILLFIAQHSKKKVAIVLKVIAILCLILLSGLRNESVGTDVLYYGKPVFEAAKNINSGTEFIRIATLYEIEYGYLALNVLIQKIGLGFQALLIIISIVTIVPTYKAIELIPYKNKWELMLVFDLIFFNQSLNNLRQFMAMSIVLYALTKFLFCDTKFRFIFLYIVLAILLHRSALISIGFFLLFCIYKRKIVSKLRFLLYAAIFATQGLFTYFLSFVSGLGFWNNKYVGHLSETVTSGIDFVGYKCALEILPLVILLMIVIKTRKIKYIETNVVLEILFLFSLISICFNLVYRAEFVERILWYVDYVSFLVAIPYFINMIKKKIKSFYIIKIYMLISFLGYWFINYIIQKSCETYPYLFFWS